MHLNAIPLICHISVVLSCIMRLGYAECPFNFSVWTAPLNNIKMLVEKYKILMIEVQWTYDAVYIKYNYGKYKNCIWKLENIHK